MNWWIDGFLDFCLITNPLIQQPLIQQSIAPLIQTRVTIDITGGERYKGGMKRSGLLIVVGFCVGLAAGLAVHPYEVVGQDPGPIVKYNRMTGRAWLFSGDHWQLIVPPVSEEAQSGTNRIPPAAK